MKYLIIHHSADLDGYASASIVLENLINGNVLKNNITTLPINYNNYTEKDVLKNIDKDTTVYLLDFSFDLELMKKICNSSNFLFWVDHHYSAEEMVNELQQEFANIQIIFNSENIMGACGLLYNYLFHDTLKSNLLVYSIALGDVCNFPSADHKYVLDFLSIIQWKDYDVLRKLLFFRTIEDSDISDKQIISIGKSISLNKEKTLLNIIESERGGIGQLYGYKTYIINNSHKNINSELLHKVLSTDNEIDIAISYSDYMKKGEEKRIFSIRTKKDDINVADIASKFDGGGHPKAAGYAMKLQDGQDFVKLILS